MSSTLAQLVLTDDADNERTIGVRMRDALQWEKRFRGRAVFMLDEDKVHLEYLYELAFVVAQREGLPGTEKFGSPDDPTSFCGMYDIAEAEESESTVDPTQPVASTGASSDSPLPPTSPLSTGSDGSTATTA